MSKSQADKKKFGGAQEGAGRPKKPGVRTSFVLSSRSREILELATKREGKKQMAPGLEAVLEDYAERHDLPVKTPKGGEGSSLEETS